MATQANPAQATYQPYDSGPRILVATTMTGGALMFLWLVFAYLFGPKGGHFGSVIWAILCAIFWERTFLVETIEQESKVLLNTITGALTAFSPGTRLKFPWEQEVEEANHGRVENTVYVVTGEKKIPASDGAVMDARWLFNYRPAFRKDGTIAPGYLSLKAEDRERVVCASLNAIVDSYLGETLPKKDSTFIRETATQTVRDYFRRIFIVKNHPLEKEYGIKITYFSLNHLDYSDEAQKARSSRFAAGQLNEGADKLAGVNKKDAINAVLVNDNKAAKTITEIEGDGANAAGAYIKSLFGR